MQILSRCIGCLYRTYIKRLMLSTLIYWERNERKKKKQSQKNLQNKNMLKFTDMLQIVENWYYAYRTQCRIRFWHILFEKSGVSIKRFSHSELEILNILTEIPSISKKGMKYRDLSGLYVFTRASTSVESYTCGD